MKRRGTGKQLERVTATVGTNVSWEDLTRELSTVTGYMTFFEAQLSELMGEFRTVEYSLGKTLSQIKEIEGSVNEEKRGPGVLRKKRHVPLLLNENKSPRGKPISGTSSKHLKKLMDDMRCLQELKNQEKMEMNSIRQQIEFLNSELSKAAERKEELEKELEEMEKFKRKREALETKKILEATALEERREEERSKLETDTPRHSSPFSGASESSSGPGSSNPSISLPVSPSGLLSPTSPVSLVFPTGVGFPEVGSEKLLSPQ